jgi:hypothetical protein
VYGDDEKSNGFSPIDYAVSIYTSLGVSTKVSLLLSAVWLTLGTIYGYLGATFSDRIGRRRVLRMLLHYSVRNHAHTNLAVLGYTCNIIVLILYTAMYGKFQETGLTRYATAAIVFNFLYELT